MSTRGPDSDLRLGPWIVRFAGLGGELGRELSRRWGGFVGSPAARPPDARVAVSIAAGGGASFLPPAAPGETYRIEATSQGAGVRVRSYAFALETTSPDRYALTLAGETAEPRGRTLDNAARWIVARLAAQAGGVALHGAGVLRGGRAWIFAGPSGSGKSTASRLSSPATSLGDDFAVVLPAGSGWAVPAVPFDNAERAPAAPPGRVHPLAGIRRLFHAKEPRVERPPAAIAEASLLACAAFPWALPDLAPAIDGAVARIVASGAFAHLHFAPDAGFWKVLEAEG